MADSSDIKLAAENCSLETQEGFKLMIEEIGGSKLMANVELWMILAQVMSLIMSQRRPEMEGLSLSCCAI